MDAHGPGPALVAIVELLVQPGRAAEFRRFETEAARIMQRHGGRIEYMIRPTVAPREPGADETHVVTLPSPERFDACRRDPDLLGLAALRQGAIARTDVTPGAATPGYGGGAP